MNIEEKQSTDANLAAAGVDVDVVVKDDGQTTDSLFPASPSDQTVPLFLKDSRNGDQGNAQDEKDSAEE